MKLSGVFKQMSGAVLLSAGILLAPVQPNPAHAADELRVGMPAKMFLNLVELVAQDKGFYERENLDVELVHIADSSVPVRALIAGELDVTQTGMSETLIAIGRGAELKTIGGVNTGLHYAFWVNSNAGIETVEDLPGKNVAISSPGSLPHVVILALLNNAGVSQEKIDEINWISVSGSSARRQAIIAGTVDATVASYNPKAERDPNAKVLFVVPEKLHDYVMTPWDTRDDVLAEHPDLLKRFMKAELLATRWLFENKAEALDVAAQHFDYTPEDMDAFYTFYRDGGIWDPNGGVSAEQAVYMQEVNVQNEMQDDVLPVEQVLDTSLLEEVLEEIGVYEKPQ